MDLSYDLHQGFDSSLVRRVAEMLKGSEMKICESRTVLPIDLENT